MTGICQNCGERCGGLLSGALNQTNAPQLLCCICYPTSGESCQRCFRREEKEGARNG